MKFIPIDEMSLRHLFSTGFAQEQLGLSYLGPVLSPAGAIETSPDCIILDMRASPFRPKRCEFKLSPNHKNEFSHNGRFDIAIIWSLPQGMSKEQLQIELLNQNGCYEIIILNTIRAFSELPVYTYESPSSLGGSDIIKKIALKSGLPSVFSIFIAAKIYPKNFNLTKMIAFLASRFPDVKKMHAKGRSNAVTLFIQTKPPLIERKHGKIYRWTSDLDSIMATALLGELLKDNYDSVTPNEDDIQSVIE